MINEQKVREIDLFLERNFESMTEDLATLVRIPSMRGDAQENAPYGSGCRDALDASLKMFEREGFLAAPSPDYKYGLAWLKGDEKTVGIFSHSDVVSVSEDWILTSPFSPKIIGDVMVGRGIKDDKAAIVENLYAFKAIRELGLPMKGSSMAFIGCNEETGMEDIDAFVERESMPGISFVPDCRYPLCIGERSGIYFVLKTERKPIGINRIWNDDGSEKCIPISVKASLVYSEELARQLSELIVQVEDVHMVVENDEIILSATGIPKHASVPDGSRNAARMICSVLRKCTTLPEETRSIMSFCDNCMEDWYGEGWGIQGEDVNFGRLHVANLGLFWDGETFTMPFVSKFGTAMDSDRIIEQLHRAMQGSGFSVEITRRIKGFYINADSKATRLILDTYQIATGESGKTYVSAANTYACKLRNAYAVGVDVPQIQPELDLPTGHGGLHQSDECISLKSVQLATKIMILMILAADEVLHSGD